MQSLIPFHSESTAVSVSADLQRAGTSLIIYFEISAPSSTVHLPRAFHADGSAISRADGLWNETCFEMFLQPVGEKKYYEFNFSLIPAWNEYVFQGYRTPSKPQASQDFLLQQMDWDGKKLKVILSGPTNSQYIVGLTAVVKELLGEKHYLALAHTSDKPDFHSEKSFILKR